MLWFSFCMDSLLKAMPGEFRQEFEAWMESNDFDPEKVIEWIDRWGDRKELELSDSGIPGEQIRAVMEKIRLQVAAVFLRGRFAERSE